MNYENDFSFKNSGIKNIIFLLIVLKFQYERMVNHAHIFLN